MKIQPIRSVKINNSENVQLNKKSSESISDAKNTNRTDLNCMPCYFPVNFGSTIQNSSKLRILFSYGLPCIYSGVIMIDPKQLNRWMKNDLFERPVGEIVELLKSNRDSLRGMEAEVMDIIIERSTIHPEYTFKELLQELKPVYSRRLRKKQAPVFHELSELFQQLPSKYNTQFQMLMMDSERKLSEAPITIPFSSYEFKYKLSKIKEDITNGQNIKEKKVINKIIKESKRLSLNTNSKTINSQLQVINNIEEMLKNSILKDNIPLRELIIVSKSRLNNEQIVVPFTRKSFIYDLLKIIEDLPDNKQEQIITTAQKLPSSKDSLPAFMMKLSHETSSKIGFRLFWPYIASIEHLDPKSLGGPDIMANYGGASAGENSARKNLLFTQQMKRRPLTPVYCQMYVDRLIELYQEGVFEKHNISPKYITDFAHTIYEQSQHRIRLDTSKLYSNHT